MTDVISVFDDIRKDTVVSPENGNMSIASFNRLSRRAELRMIDYLTGDVEGVNPPFPFMEQKNRDWIAHLIEEKQFAITNGKLDLPNDYYKYDDFYAIEPKDENCSEEVAESIRRPIVLKPSGVFNQLLDTTIDELKPENGNYIATLQKGFTVAPKNILDARLIYIRYPKFGKIVSRTNQEFNIEEPDPEKSQNYEWPEYARELLIYFITDMASNKNFNQTTKEFNEITNKSATK